MSFLNKLFQIGLLLGMSLALSSCEPNVYGSVGVSSSSWGGYGGGGMRGSVSVGGRICC